MMMIRAFSLLAFGVQIFLGNICMMQMASAQDMDMPSMHETHQEEPAHRSDCDSGHCLTHAMADEPAAALFLDSSSASNLPPSPDDASPCIRIMQAQPPSTAPPDLPFAGYSTVLRC